MFNFLENQHAINMAASAGAEHTIPQWKALFGSWYALAVPD